MKKNKKIKTNKQKKNVERINGQRYTVAGRRMTIRGVATTHNANDNLKFNAFRFN